MAKLQVERISKLSSFEKIRDDWEQLYKIDSNSHIYISWLWLHAWFSASSNKLLILAVKSVDTSTYVAFLPLTIFERKYFGVNLIRQIANAGKPISAYSSFLCLPDFEPEAIQLLASYFQSSLRWDFFHVNWTKDPRFGTFLNSFPVSKFSIEVMKSHPSLGITLPDDYQVYLNNNVSKETRRKIRRRTRFIQKDKRFKITYSTADTVYRDINITCDLWFNRWHKEKETEWHRKIMFDHFENGLLRLSIIWDGVNVVSALACIIDPENKVYNAYITGYNPDYSKISPGIVIFAESIKQAIKQNYKHFDFTVGLDPYKLSFGPEQIETVNITIKRKSLKNTLKSLAGKLKRIISRI